MSRVDDEVDVEVEFEVDVEVGDEVDVEVDNTVDDKIDDEADDGVADEVDEEIGRMRITTTAIRTSNTTIGRRASPEYPRLVMATVKKTAAPTTNDDGETF